MNKSDLKDLAALEIQIEFYGNKAMFKSLVEANFKSQYCWRNAMVKKQKQKKALPPHKKCT